MQTQTRIVGSGFTSFNWAGQPIAFLDDFTDSGQPPIVQYQAVTPLGAPYPVEFALPQVRSEGTLQFTIRELWNQPVWWALGQNAPNTYTQGTSAGTFQGTQNIVDVYKVMASLASQITCTTIITIPGVNGASQYRGWTYNNVALTQIDDREQVQIGSLTMPRTLQAVYAFKTLIPLTTGATTSVL
jgi:hypothetical protein